MQMSEEQSFPCDELGCDRSFKNRTALLKHKRNTHIAKTRKSTRVREGGRVYNPSATSPSKFTVAQASRNSKPSWFLRYEETCESRQMYL